MSFRIPDSLSLRRMPRGLAALLLAAALAVPVQARADVAETVLPAACTRDCAAPWGETLGGSTTTPAYSNCSAACFVPLPNREQGIFTGIRWQCVEYARRWWLLNRGVFFGDVDVAADLWLKIPAVTRASDGSTQPLENHDNGDSAPPQVGDLLVYGREYLRTGHLAVVVAVDAGAGRIDVAEQNFLNRPWPAADHARSLDLLERKGRWWVLDPYLLGWKRIAGE